VVRGADARYSRSSPQTSTFCPCGEGTNDGCGQSPIVTLGVRGALVHSDFFYASGYANTIASTTANYSATNCGTGSQPCHPQCNVPGVDWGVGNYTPISQLLDPAVPANQPAGCSWATF
jgi:hypothetical protein